MNCHTDIIISLLEKPEVCNNLSLSGWLLELKFYLMLRVKCDSKEGKIRLMKNDGEVEEWPATNYISIDFGDHSMSCVPKNKDCWLVPTNYEQPAFHLIQLYEKTLRVVQVTNGETHAYKLEYVVSLLNDLRNAEHEITSVDIVVVVCKGNKEKGFTLGTISDECNLEAFEIDYTEKTKWKKDHIRILEWDTADLYVY